MESHDRDTDYSGQSLDLMSRATAFMNQVWLVVSNHCEKDAYSTHDDYYGGSQIVDPAGRVIAYAADEEGLVVETVELEETIWRVRTRDFAACNLLQDRRPELYGAIVDQSFKFPPTFSGDIPRLDSYPLVSDSQIRPAAPRTPTREDGDAAGRTTPHPSNV
jgi:hypothetical protein